MGCSVLLAKASLIRSVYERGACVSKVLPDVCMKEEGVIQRLVMEGGFLLTPQSQVFFRPCPLGVTLRQRHPFTRMVPGEPTYSKNEFSTLSSTSTPTFQRISFLKLEEDRSTDLWKIVDAK